MIHASPAKITQQTVQARFHAMDIHVMAKARLGADARECAAGPASISHGWK